MPLRYVAGRDGQNSTLTPLDANETFVGEWVQNNEEHIAFNCLSDQDGELFLEFSIDGSDALTTLSKRYEIAADVPEFDALVKIPGRFHRVRYVNGGTAQGKLGVLTSTGDRLYPYAVSDRDAPAFAASNGSSVSATAYRLLVDLDDRTNYPHKNTGRVDIHSAFFFVDKAANTVGALRLGVITRIDGTDADVVYVQGISFNSTSDRSFARDRIFESPIRCGQASEALTRVASGFTASNIAAINTGTTLPTQFGTATPAVGDLVAEYSYTSGTAYDGAISIQYTTSSSTA